MGFWEEIFIPIAIGPIFIFAKYLWDRYDDTLNEIMRNKYEKRMNKLQSEVKDFYWPLYFNLIENQQLWKFTHEYNLLAENTKDPSICRANDTDTSDTDTDNDEASYIYILADKHNSKIHSITNVNKCMHTYDNGSQCSVTISSNKKRLFGKYCMAHFFLHNGNVLSRMKITTNSWLSILKQTDIETNLTQPTNTLIKVQSNLSEHDIKDYHYSKILQLFNDNHTNLSNIIHNYLPIVNAKSRLGSSMVKFIQYVKAFEMLNCDKLHLIINPKKLNAYYPKKLFNFIEKQLFRKQKMLNETQTKYYEDLDALTSNNCLKLWTWCLNRWFVRV